MSNPDLPSLRDADGAPTWFVVDRLRADFHPGDWEEQRWAYVPPPEVLKSGLQQDRLVIPCTCQVEPHDGPVANARVELNYTKVRCGLGRARYTARVWIGDCPNCNKVYWSASEWREVDSLL